MNNPVIQAAGHEGIFQNDTGELFIKSNTAREELEFYQEIASRQDEEMQMITCAFLGILTEQQIVNGAEEITHLVKEAEETQDLSKIQRFIKPNKNTTIVLENALFGYTSPSVLDVKLGSVLYDDSASDEKRERLAKVSETTTSGSLSLRIAGMNVFDPETQTRNWHDKFFGRALTEQTVLDGFHKFFPESIELEKRRAICEGIKHELRFIHEVMSRKEIRLISSSVLIIYEGDPQAFDEKLEKGNLLAEKANDEEDDDDDDEEEEEESYPLYTVKLIDFAHTSYCDNQGPDIQVLTGIQNLITIFTGLEQKYS
ncbi:inositol polyphosphate multikinase [Trichomonascus vanleenenianus]|uniref:inositol polyphosphate multikinase n=1 Tax=Trichomonascus vanleenenianus TaxID=2268995 RepID=UPI003EC977BD